MLPPSLSGAREYHVQFFSNQPERAWVHEKRVREYKGRKQYDQLVLEAAKQANHSEKQKVCPRWVACFTSRVGEKLLRGLLTLLAFVLRARLLQGLPRRFPFA